MIYKKATALTLLSLILQSCTWTKTSNSHFSHRYVPPSPPPSTYSTTSSDHSQRIREQIASENWARNNQRVSRDQTASENDYPRRRAETENRNQRPPQSFRTERSSEMVWLYTIKNNKNWFAYNNWKRTQFTGEENELETENSNECYPGEFYNVHKLWVSLNGRIGHKDIVMGPGPESNNTQDLDCLSLRNEASLYLKNKALTLNISSLLTLQNSKLIIEEGTLVLNNLILGKNSVLSFAHAKNSLKGPLS